MRIPLIYNLRSLWQRRTTTAATIVGIGLVVLTFVGMLALANGFRAAMISTGRMDNVIVIRAGADAELSSGITREQAAIIKALPQVARDHSDAPLASADVYVVITMARDDAGGSLANIPVRGVDFASFPTRDQVRIVAGRNFEPGRPEIIVGSGIARRVAGAAVGDVVELGTGQFTVVGHFDAEGGAFESEIWGENEQLMGVFRGPVYQSVTFRLAEPAAFEDAAAQLAGDPRLDVDVHREAEFFEGQSSLLTSILRFVAFFVTAIMAIGAIFGAVNTMEALVSARSQEIALLLTLGFRPRSVTVSFLLESLMLALAGGLLGCILALPLNGITTSTTNFQSFAELAFEVRVSPPILTQGLAFAAVMGFIGGLLPAWHASRQVIAQALRKA